MAESLTTRKMVLIIAVSTAVTAVVVSLIFGIIIKHTPQDSPPLPIPTKMDSETLAKLVSEEVKKIQAHDEMIRLERAVPADGPKHVINMTGKAEHRFVEGDLLRHVSGNPKYDIEIKGVHSVMTNTSEKPEASYSVEVENSWMGLYGHETIPVDIVDTGWNKK